MIPKKSEVYRDSIYILSLDRNHSSVQDFLITEFEQAIQEVNIDVVTQYSI